MAFSPVVGHIPVSGGYQTLGFFNSPVQAQNAHLGYVPARPELLDAHLAKLHRTNFTPTAGLASKPFNTNAILPNTQQPFPSDLWNVSLGTGYRHLFDNGYIAGGLRLHRLGQRPTVPFHP